MAAKKGKKKNMSHILCNDCFDKLGPMEEQTIGLLGEKICSFCLRKVTGKEAHQVAGDCPAPGSLHPLFDTRCTCTELEMVWREDGEPDLKGKRADFCPAHWPVSLEDARGGAAFPFPPIQFPEPDPNA